MVQTYVLLDCDGEGDNVIICHIKYNTSGMC